MNMGTRLTLRAGAGTVEGAGDFDAGAGIHDGGGERVQSWPVALSGSMSGKRRCGRAGRGWRGRTRR